MTFPEIALLALVQGAAELLPVSSSAHVIVAERLLGIDPSSPEATFLLVMLHTGTMFAVLWYFWPRWRVWFHSSPGAATPAGPGWHFLKMILLATTVTGVLGLGLKLFIEKVILIGWLGHEKGEIEHLFKELPLVAGALFAVGVLIIAAGAYDTGSQTGPLTPGTSVAIGIIQGLCLPFRGFSRSGATISVGLFRGLPRALAEDFSFALAVVLTPPVIILELYRLWRAREGQPTAFLELIGPGLVGMVCSFLAGLVALRVLSAALEKGRWKYFGYYCIGASLAVMAAARAGL
jgi:undecaprenyl-diphosphatase